MALPTPLTLQLSSSPSLIRRGVVGHGFLNNRRVDSPILASATRSFEVTLRTPTGDKVIQVPEDVYVTDAAESAGIILPMSCRSGNCSSCAAVLKSGIVDQSYQTFLSDEQVADGFVLTCVAYPLSDSVIETHQESRLYS